MKGGAEEARLSEGSVVLRTTEALLVVDEDEQPGGDGLKLVLVYEYCRGEQQRLLTESTAASWGGGVLMYLGQQCLCPVAEVLDAVG